MTRATPVTKTAMASTPRRRRAARWPSVVRTVAAIAGGIAVSSLAPQAARAALPSECTVATTQPEPASYTLYNCYYAPATGRALPGVLVDGSTTWDVDSAGNRVRKNNGDHAVDVYVPVVTSGSAALATREVAMFVYGGGFVSGDKGSISVSSAGALTFNGDMPAHAHAYAKKGIVAVVPNYTLRACNAKYILPPASSTNTEGCKIQSASTGALPGQFSNGANLIDGNPSDGDSPEEDMQFASDIADALVWVNYRLAAGGTGDPYKITYVGHSAGALAGEIVLTSKGYSVGGVTYGNFLEKARQRFCTRNPSCGFTPSWYTMFSHARGMVAVSGTGTLNAQYDTSATWPLQSLDGFDWFKTASDRLTSPNSRIAGSGPTIWQMLSPAFHVSRQSTLDVPVWLAINGGFGTGSVNAVGTPNEPTGVSTSSRDLVRYLQRRGGNAAFVQPVFHLTALYSTINCSMLPGHAGTDLALSLTINPTTMATQYGTYNLCGLAAAAAFPNATYQTTIESFVRTGSPVFGAVANDNTGLFSASSVANGEQRTSATPTRIGWNFGGGSQRGNFKSARLDSVAPLRAAGEYGGPTEATVTGATWWFAPSAFTYADPSAADNPPFEIFQHQAIASGPDTMRFAQAVPNGNYKLRVWFGEFTQERFVDVYVGSATTPVLSKVSSWGGALGTTKSVDTGTIAITNGQLSLRFVHSTVNGTLASGGDPMIAGVELIPVP